MFRVQEKKKLEKIHEKETNKVKDFAEIYKQNLVDIVEKIQELETKSSESGYDLTLNMYELDIKPTVSRYV